MRTEDLSATAALAAAPAGAKKMPQGTVDYVENSSDALRNTETAHTYIPLNASLDLEHRQYLMHRHGTLDLDPMPGPGASDPYNWPHWRVSTTHSVSCSCLHLY
jgi:hypothetical protein